MEKKQKKASEPNDVTGDRRVTRSASGRGRTGESSQVVIQRNPPTINNLTTNNPTQQPRGVETGDNVAVRQDPRPIPPDSKKQRTTWTLEMNEYVVRSYFRITKGETSKEPYGAELHRLILEKYPELRHKTLQNILDQRRSIFSNKRIKADRINQIKEEILIELGMQEERQEEPNVPETDNQNTDEPPSEAREEFRKSLMEYDGMEPTLKPRIAKLEMKRNTKTIIEQVNKIIEDEITDNTTIQELHSLVYVGAITILKLNGQKLEGNRVNKKTKEPAWERRIKSRINAFRRDIGILTQYQRAAPSQKVKKEAEVIVKQHKSEDNPTIIEVTDYLKQKLAATAQKLRRYKKSNLRRQQNNLFENNQKIFYKSLETKPNDPDPLDNSVPNATIINNFWAGIWSTPVNHERRKWLHQERTRTRNLKTMLGWKISKQDVEKALKKCLNWKAPGLDKIQNFWFKTLTSTHEHLAKCYNRILEQPHTLPTFMTCGVSYLIPKTKKYTADPAKYRPITCLPTIYKILTSILSDKIYKHLEENRLLDEEQKGCRKGSRGCKEQLIIDTVVINKATQKKGSMFTAYIDYQKAFDSIPHSWLLEVLHLYGIEDHIREFLTHAMSQWKTQLYLNTPDTQIQAGDIEIKRGIFQGDALSPLWFCLALRPLTSLLNDQRKGYALDAEGTQISHLWYMDDLKLFSGKKEHLHSLLDCVGRFSSDIQMKFGLDKCRISCMEKGIWKEHTGYNVNDRQGRITGMQEEEQYKYLGYLQAQGIDHKVAKQQATDTYMKRLRAILKSELSAINTSKAINTYATSVLTYTFGILNWTDTELNAMNIATRKEFRKHRAHHPHSAIERFHLPRKEGGRGIPSIPAKHYAQVENLRKYFIEKTASSKLHEAVVRIDSRTPLKLSNIAYDPTDKIPSTRELRTQWKSKALHGRYVTTIEDNAIDTKGSQAWLQSGNLFKETEGFIAAIQDQIVPTKVYRKRIMKEELEDVKCRMCREKEEYLDHLLAGCSVLAPKQYLERHNSVAKIIHIELQKKYMETANNEAYYVYTPPPVIETDNYLLYWNRKIITDKTIPNNIPDIVLTQKKEKKCFIIDIAVPLPANIQKTNAEKINKYIPLADEIRAMWGMHKVEIIPIVIGATGEIPKQLHQSIETLQLNKNLYTRLQKAALLDTCRIIRRVLGNETTPEANA